jgi:hypothetical protein
MALQANYRRWFPRIHNPATSERFGIARPRACLAKAHPFASRRHPAQRLADDLSHGNTNCYGRAPNPHQVGLIPHHAIAEGFGRMNSMNRRLTLRRCFVDWIRIHEEYCS